MWQPWEALLFLAKFTGSSNALKTELRKDIVGFAFATSPPTGPARSIGGGWNTLRLEMSFAELFELVLFSLDFLIV